MTPTGAVRSPLRRPAFVALLAAETISTTGTQMTWIALPWFVLVTSGSAGRMGLVLAAEVAGVALASLPGANVAARLGPRRTMLVADAARAPLMLLVPALHWSGGLSFPLLLGLVFSVGAFAGPYYASQSSIVAELLGENERLVGQASALAQIAQRTTFLLGPPLGGVLVGLLGAAEVLVVDAASYAVAFLLVGALVHPPRRPPAAERERRGTLEGLRFLAREPLLRVWSATLAVGDTAFLALAVTVPFLAYTRYGQDARIAGLAWGAFGAGAIVGNAVAYRLVARVEGLRIISLVSLGQALPLWLLVVRVPAWVLVAVFFASSLANGLVNPPLHAITTLRIPSHLRAQALSALAAVNTLLGPLGALAAGPSLDRFGAAPVLAAVAATQTAAMLSLSLSSARAARATAAPVASSSSRTPPDPGS